MDRHAVQQHQYLGVAEAPHAGLVAGGIGLDHRDAGEVQARDGAQKLVDGLGRRLADVLLGHNGGVQGHLLSKGVAAARGNDDGLGCRCRFLGFSRSRPERDQGSY